MNKREDRQSLWSRIDLALKDLEENKLEEFLSPEQKISMTGFQEPVKLYDDCVALIKKHMSFIRNDRTPIIFLYDVNTTIQAIKKDSLDFWRKKKSAPVGLNNVEIDLTYDHLAEYLRDLFRQTSTLRCFYYDDIFERDINDKIAKVDKLIDVARDKVTEATHLLEKARVEVGAKATSLHAKFFKRQGLVHSVKAILWLIVLTAILAGGGYLALYLIFDFTLPQDANLPTIVSISIGKIIMFTMIFYAISFSGKASRAHQHNAIVNKHRALSLQTFETFTTAAGDPDIKNQILIATTQAIFTASVSGFLGGDKVDSPLIGQLQNILGAGATGGPGAN